MSTDQPSEAELRAAYEAEIKRIGVEQILLEQVVTLINLGMRRTGLAPGTEDERDPAQVRLAIDSVRALLPLLEQTAAGADRAGPIREALSQMQLTYVRMGGGAEPAETAPSAGPGAPAEPSAPPASPPPGSAGPSAPPPAPEPGQPGEAGPAQRSGRLWVPGQR
jgi:hypothetical protein